MEWYIGLLIFLGILGLIRFIVVLKQTPQDESIGGFFKRFACGKTYTGC